jgi:8-oxo-dGTP pyrophosphatase MutT (NUDIX family)
MVRVDETPHWLLPLISALRRAQPGQLSLNDPPASQIADRQAAVLILLAGAGPDVAEVVLVERARGLRDHPGEISFPGGGWEPDDTSPVDTALREAAEETGVDPGYWHRPSPLTPTDPPETQRVFSIALRELAQPNRWQDYTVPGWHGPSTRLEYGALLWGYTAEVLLFISRNI